MTDTALLKRGLALVALILAVVAYLTPGPFLDVAVVLLAIAILL
jgi:hypothetical protein